MYRTYASNEVIKIRKLPPSMCKSRDGSLTGLEAVTINCAWEPARDVSKGRLVDGTFNLISMPHLLPGTHIRPASLVEGSAEKFLITYRAAVHKWPHPRPEFKQWQKLQLKIMPRDDDAERYHREHPSLMERPLEEFFGGESYALSTVTAVAEEVEAYTYMFDWPTLFGAANACVRSTSNPEPPAPFTYFNLDGGVGVTAISRFTTDSQSYYDLVVKVAYTGAKQKALVLRKVDASGDRTIAVSGNKAEVGQRLMEWDVDIMRAIVKPLIRDEAEFTAGMVGDDPVGDDIIATTYGVNIQRRHLWEFQLGKALSTFIVAQFVRLIKADDDRLCDAHRAFGGTRPGYIEVKKSFFADPLIIGSLLSDDGSLREECAAYIREQEVATMHRLFIPIYSGRGTSLEIVVVHILDKT
ncbi:hypothetical protein B484DRAFT_473076, partial [Ochromonadaceae sp. CCMP2298]